MSIEEITEGLPDAFVTYSKEVREYEFTTKPRYDYLRSLFYNLLESRDEKYDPYTDWLLKKL